MEEKNIINEIVEAVKERFADIKSISVENVVKINDQPDIAISVGDGEVTRLFSLDAYIQRAKEFPEITNSSTFIDEIAGNIMENCTKKGPRFDFEACFKRYEEIKSLLSIRVCDPMLNEKFLQNKIFFLEGNLAGVFYLKLSASENVIGRVYITQDLLKNWGVSVDKLKEDTFANLEKAEPPVLAPMKDMIFAPFKKTNLLECGETIPLKELSEMYVLTTDCGIDGANVYLRRDVMTKVSEILGVSFWILPSSAHELLLVPDLKDLKGPDFYENLKAMVKEANRTLDPMDLLSENVFYYAHKETR